MSKTEETLLQIFKSLPKNLDNHLTKDDIIKAFSLENIPLTQQDLSSLFSDIDQDLDQRLSYEEIRFWFLHLHPINPLDCLLYYKLKAFDFYKHSHNFFSKAIGPNPESIYEKNIHSGLFSVNFGELDVKYNTKANFSMDFNENLNGKILKDVSSAIILRFRLDKTVKNQQIQQIFEEFQKNFKGLVLVAQNLNKKLREILKELNFSYVLEGNEICLIIRFSDKLQKFILDFNETLVGFLQTHQKSETFRFRITMKNSLDYIMDKMLESPIIGLVALLSDSKIEFSGYIRKLMEGVFDISKEKMGNQSIEDLIGLFLLLKSMKLKVFLHNLNAEEIESSGLIEFLPESSFFLEEIMKFELPKMPIIKKFYQMFGVGFEGRLKGEFRFEGFIMKAGVRSEGLLKVFNRFFTVL